MSSGSNAGNHFLPVSDQYKESRFSIAGEFSRVVPKKDYFSYSKIVFKELEGQYLCFKKLTEGHANYDHVDCHLYCNLSLPVAVAYREIIKKYHIRSARYYGEHHKSQNTFRHRLKFHIANFLNGSEARVVKSCNVDYYMSLQDSFLNDEIIELYVHPDYINDVLLDNTVSVFGHAKAPLIDQIEALKSTGDIQLISWVDFN